jgi:hypothetical protein
MLATTSQQVGNSHPTQSYLGPLGLVEPTFLLIIYALRNATLYNYILVVLF